MNSENIEIGAGNLTLQFDGDVAPVDVGGCANAELEIKNEEIDVQFDQLLDPADTFIVGREITFSVDLKEDTLRNLVIAAGGDPAGIDDGDTDPTKAIYEFPANSVSPAAFAELTYSVAQVRNKTKVKKVVLYKVKNMGGVKFKYEKKKERIYSCKFRAYADNDQGGKPGKIIYDK